MKIKTKIILLVMILLLAGCVAKKPQLTDNKSNLAEWRKGVWIDPSGNYSIFTDTHYFVLYIDGDTTQSNIYCGSSQIVYHSKGMARYQVARYRQNTGRNLEIYKNSSFKIGDTEEKLVIDTTLFEPGKCNIVDGIIYDSITEETEEYVLLSSCNGDKIKIFSNGVSSYLPASGGEYFSYRIEKL